MLDRRRSMRRILIRSVSRGMIGCGRGRSKRRHDCQTAKQVNVASSMTVIVHLHSGLFEGNHLNKRVGQALLTNR